MELESILDPRRRGFGRTCKNCVHLACEYDLENGMDGHWVCNKFQNFGDSNTFPFKIKMTCFEPSFWFTVFAPDWNATEDALEDAFNRFTDTLNSIGVGKRSSEFLKSSAGQYS